ncbi:MAG: 2-amino-4-hydroxy-6-hydroxymethyldihydropteridine diphosphokinase [Gammaproteobacteria bacterium]|nr:2-amino-4-hydroxy-6-hydroxymethyldihydropteridine diphosphokinase [Gammaproteobacteria bacterium]
MTRQSVWTPAYVALGSNLGDPVAQLERALGARAGLPGTRLVAASAFYCNPPLGPQDQPHFVNAAAGLLTQMSPEALLAGLKAIESAQGRRREAEDRWGPRVLDLDLLLYGSRCSAGPGLVLPHPGVAERNFVLFPLLEVAPGLRIPGLGRAAVLAANLERSGLECVRPARPAEVTGPI